MPEIFSGPVTGWPSIRILPRDGIFSPVASFMKVDLPQPEGPTMAMNSPSSTFIEMSSTANWFFARSSSLYASQTLLKLTNAMGMRSGPGTRGHPAGALLLGQLEDVALGGRRQVGVGPHRGRVDALLGREGIGDLARHQAEARRVDAAEGVGAGVGR